MSGTAFVKGYEAVAIKNWHWGKVVLIWVAGLFLMWFLVEFFRHGTPPSDSAPTIAHVVFGILVAVLIATPIAIVVVTWKWLTGRERDGGGQD